MKGRGGAAGGGLRVFCKGCGFSPTHVHAHARTHTHACTPAGIRGGDEADEVTEDGASLVWQ